MVLRKCFVVQPEACKAETLAINCSVFIKPISKYISGSQEYKRYYRLVESYRSGDSVRHHTILQLGSLEELGDIERIKQLGLRIESLVQESRSGIKEIFEPTDAKVEELARYYFGLICDKGRLDVSRGYRYEAVDTDTIENKEVREVGAEWLCAQTIERLGMAKFLTAQGWDEQAVNLSITHVISRACYPASELRTSQWIKENSSVCELTGYAQNLITKDKLYGISKALYTQKDGLEIHLGKRTNELFDLTDSIQLYDLTNTYYEGQMNGSVLAQYGRSKEKRSDCKLIVLAMVTNMEGFIKYSQIFEGNMADSNSLIEIIEALSQRTSATGRKPIVVMDAGIATEANILLLRQYGFDYMCVSRSSMKKYEADTNSKPIQICDKRKQPISLQKVKVDGSTDNYLLVHSQAKQAKEQSMNKAFVRRYEEALTAIHASLTKKGGIKKTDKVWERIGRVKQQYPSLNKHYDIQVIADDKGIATALKWQQKPAPERAGKYLLRTNLKEEDERTQWAIYNSIREIEATFRTLKTDLDLRPIFHKTDQASMAHLHLGLLAYTSSIVSDSHSNRKA